MVSSETKKGYPALRGKGLYVSAFAAGGQEENPDSHPAPYASHQPARRWSSASGKTALDAMARLVLIFSALGAL